MQLLQHPSLSCCPSLSAPRAAASSRRLVMQGFVGQHNTPAAEYHNSDFDWQQHAQATAHLVEQQWAAAPAAVRQAAQLSPGGVPLSAVAQLLASLEASSAGVSTDQHQRLQPEAHQPPQQQLQQPSCPTSLSAADNEWETFYQAHPTAKFFKERRYLLLEFPCLAAPASLQHVVEIGAGCGSSILPVLRAQPGARATVCDVSATCLQQLMGAVSLLGLHPERCSCFVADGTDPGLVRQLAGCAADAALIMFTLSAVPPAGMLAMMRNAAAALRPGGLLCIRDHALFDMVQLRIPGEQAIGRHLYRRGDDTLAYFFTTEDLSGLALAAGLEVVECEFVCVINKNRKSGLELRRTFVHGVFRRPELL